MKYCADCSYYNTFGNCNAADGKVNIITGNKFSCAKDPLEMRYTEAYCGKDAVWFNPKGNVKQGNAMSLNAFSDFPNHVLVSFGDFSYGMDRESAFQFVNRLMIAIQDAKK